MNKKETRGGTRQGSGVKPKHNEEIKTNIMLYVRTSLHWNEFKVCDEITDEVVAIFFTQQDAIDYVNWKTKKEKRF